ncbi:hypothetical protein V8G54_015487 [Vigna mungo]|uniref:Uncharacterized protein n=1 Tax=Vigna mungo TaxID=3915 RepID=A0AAQ3NM22_VIGMU
MGKSYYDRYLKTYHNRSKSPSEICPPKHFVSFNSSRRQLFFLFTISRHNFSFSLPFRFFQFFFSHLIAFFFLIPDTWCALLVVQCWASNVLVLVLFLVLLVLF